MNKFCPNCGKELNENQIVCLNCGVSVNNTVKPVSDNKEKFALTGFILGLVSIVAWLLPFIGYPVTICGIIFSSKGLNSTNNKTKATVGLILSIIFLVITLINSIMGVVIYTNSYYY